MRKTLYLMLSFNFFFFSALSNILENTALFGELLLHFPEISHAVLKDSHEWKVLYEWSVRFSNQTELLDRITTTLIDLVSNSKILAPFFISDVPLQKPVVLGLGF